MAKAQPAAEKKPAGLPTHGRRSGKGGPSQGVTKKGRPMPRAKTHENGIELTRHGASWTEAELAQLWEMRNRVPEVPHKEIQRTAIPRSEQSLRLKSHHMNLGYRKAAEEAELAAAAAAGSGNGGSESVRKPSWHSTPYVASSTGRPTIVYQPKQPTPERSPSMSDEDVAKLLLKMGQQQPPALPAAVKQQEEVNKMAVAFLMAVENAGEEGAGGRSKAA